MPRLGTADGKKSVFTVPPINEQNRIADKIDQLFSILDTISALIFGLMQKRLALHRFT